MITTTIIKRVFLGDGLTTVFPVDIEGVPDAPTGANHVALSIADATGKETPLVYGADFSLAANIANGFSRSFVVTLERPLAAGLTLVVRRTTPVVSISSYPEDRTPPRQVERDIDNLIKIGQEQEREAAQIREDLASEVETRTKEIARLDAALAEETAAREASDRENAAAIEREVAAREKAVDDEASARAAGDKAIAAAINTETKTREEADAALQSQITDLANGKADKDELAGMVFADDLRAMAYIDDAPSDSGQYARQDGAWKLVVGGGGEGVTMHAQLNGRNAANQHSLDAITDLIPALDAKADAEHTHPVTGVTSVAGKTGDVTLEKADVGLDNVDNTADSEKSVASATTLTETLGVDKGGTGANTASAALATLGGLAISARASQADVAAKTDNTKYVTSFGLAALAASGGFNAERLITTSGSVTLDNAAGVALVVVIGGGGGGGAGNNGGGGRGGGKTSATIGGITCAASGGGGGGRGYYSGYFTAQGAGGGGGGAGGGGSGASNGQDGSATKGGDGGGLYAGVGGNNGDVAANGSGSGKDGTAGISGNPGTAGVSTPNGVGATAGIGGTGGITFGAALNGTNYGKAGNGVTAPQGSSGGGGAGGACLYIVTLPKNASFTASIGAGGATGSGGVAGTPGTQGCIYIIYGKA